MNLFLLILGCSYLGYTLFISSGQEIKSVSKRLGARNTTTTLNIYTHTDRSSYKKTAKEMEKILFKNAEK